MKTKTFIQSLYFFLVLATYLIAITYGKGSNENGMSNERVVINSLSTKIDQENYKPYGSIEGGTVIYLQAYGHNRTPSKNTIYVGPYPCLIEENGISGDIISCRTTKAFDPTRRISQKVVLNVSGKEPSKCEAINHCNFNYYIDKTPQLNMISPSASIPSSTVNWNGVWKVDSSSQIEKLLIGGYNCNRFELDDSNSPLNLNDDEDIDSKSNQSLPCQLSSEITAGHYTVDSQNAKGNFFKKSTLQNLSYDGQNQYEFTVTANIDNISSNSGGEYGNRLVISGSGFSNQAENITVQIEDNQCDIISVTNTQIVCDLQSGSTPQPSSDPNEQIYTSGTGVGISLWQFDNDEENQYYDFNIDNFITAVNEQTIESSRLLFDEIYGNWEYQVDNEYQKQGIHSKGFFRAPRSGEYKFYLAAADRGQVFLNQVPNNTQFSQENLILEKCNFNNFRRYFYPEDCGSVSEAITLQEGENYWIEVFVYVNNFNGHFTLSVETPEPERQDDGDRWINALDETQAVQIIPTTQYQRFSVKVFDTEEQFSLNFYYKNPKTRKVEFDTKTWNKTWAFWAADDERFIGHIDDKAGNFGAELVEAYDLDASGNRCNGCTAKGREWVFDFTLYRGGSKNVVPNCSLPKSNCVVEKLQEQSEPVSGTFKLHFLGEPVEIYVNDGYTQDIPFDYNVGGIKGGLTSLNDDFINVIAFQRGRYEDGLEYLFNFRSTENKEQWPQFQADASGLQGGVIGTKPTIKVTRSTKSSANPFYEPIPYDMSYLPASNPTVGVLVNGIPSRCSTDCTYQTDDSLNFSIDSFDLSGNTLSVQLSGIQSGITLQDISIDFAGSQCTNLTGTVSNISCDLSAIEAGDNIPRVLVSGQGFASFDGNSETILPTISQISPDVVGINGGNKITIQGTGFPQSDLSAVSVTIGGTEAIVISTSNTEIIALTPAKGQGNKNVKVISNNKNSANYSQFSYTSAGVAQISSINPTTASPVLKQDIVINGSDFGASVDEIEVWLLNENGEKTYELNVLPQNFANDQITARLGGGHVGTYQLAVFNTKGISNNNPTFKYIITLDSVSPQISQDKGGQIVTLTGTNFSKLVSDNNVFLSDGIEDLHCYVISCSQTEIVVRTPPRTQTINNNNLEFVVQGRLIETATCTGDCSFSYSGSSPDIDDFEDKNVRNGEILALTGTNLVVTQGEPYLEINGEQFTGVEFVELIDSSSINITIPLTIPTGYYWVFIYLGDAGLAGAFELKVRFHAGKVRPSEQISLGGDFLTIDGSGYDEDTFVTVNNVPCPVVEFTSSLLKCLSPVLYEEGDYKITIDKIGADKHNSYWKAKYRNADIPQVYTNLTGSLNKTYDLSSYIENFEAVDYSVHVTQASSTFSFDLVNVNEPVEVYLYSIENPKFYLTGVVSENTVTFSNTVAGSYRIIINFVNQGFAQLPAQSVWEVQFTLPEISISSGQETGLIGGSALTLSGAGFQEENQSDNLVTVCGQICDIQSVSYDEIQCILPAINTKYLDEKQISPTIVLTPLFNNEFNLVGKVKTNKSNNQNVANDWDLDNKYNLIDLSSENNEECWVLFESNQGQKIEFQSIVWNMPSGTPSERKNVTLEDQYYEFIAEGSDDGISWTKIGDNNPYDKVNYIKAKEQQQASFGFGGFKVDEQAPAYKYIRARESAQEQRINTCKYQSVYLYGRSVYENEITDNSDLSCSVQTIVNKQVKVLNTSVNYKGNLTPVIQSVSPAYVSIAGGDELTISGQNLSNASVQIDGIECNITSNTNTQIVCIVGRNEVNPVNSELKVVLNNGSKAIIEKEVVFFSGLFYSNELNTWSGESVPRDGDSVFVPKGQTLIVDESNEGVLNTVIVEGTLVFKDGVDIQFNAKYIIIRSGKLVVGSEFAPHTSNLIITMFGTVEDKQLPEFGNKVLGCHTCQLDIHGQEKIPTWSTLKQSVQVGATSIKLNDGQTNWTVGDEIGIAPTGYFPTENEKRTIATIQHKNSGDIITFTEPLEFKHISEIEEYNGIELPMQAEVVNLTRNIKFRGNPDDSIVNKYGGHVKVHGSSVDGSIVRISYVEFQYTGQPEIIGRYNLHFHMIGNAIRSYVKGISAHDTFARLVAVHSIHNLLIKDNVGFNNQGHNIFLEDGSETGNVIDSNVVISPKSAQNMLQTDITVAGIWVTHPSNYVRNNHVAGSEFYGMWYEIKERVGAHPNVCPIGSIVLQVENNVAHSNTRFGERFFNLQPRKYPCRAYKNDLLEDPWAENPSVQTIFKGGNYWKNGESGILAEFVGNSIFKDYLLADNYRTGFQAHVTNFTAEYVILQDSLIVGETQSNDGQPEDQKFETSAILVPRTDGFLARNIDIHNFPEGFNIVESSSENQHFKMWTQGGYQSEFEGLTLTNCENSGTIKWQGPRRNLVYDRDGTLTGNNDGQPRWITPYYNYLEQAIRDGICIKPQNEYDDSVVCTQPIRGIKFGGMDKKENFIGQNLRVFNLQDEIQGENFGTENEDQDYFDQLPSMKIKNKPHYDFIYGFAATILTGYTYNLHWSDGIDFNSALLYPSYNTQPNDPTTILRFNYTESREVFDIKKIVAGEEVHLFTPGGSISKFVDENNQPNNGPDGCTYGEYFDDKENQFLYLCINGKERGDQQIQQIQLEGVYCRDTCSSGFQCSAGEEKLLKQFFNQNQAVNDAQYDEQPLRKLPGEEEWQIGVPQRGDDVLIPCNWVLSFNLEEWEFGTLIIDGIFRVEEGFDNVHIKANNIWVRGGKFIAGNPEEGREYTKNLTIELVGNDFSEPLVIDEISKTGTKSLAVTSELELYGKYPSTTQTRLVSTVQDGDNTISVQDDISDWKVGDEIVLGASKIDGIGFEKHTISAINIDSRTVTLENNIENWHYGNPNPTVGPQANAEVNIDEKYGGTLDMRTVVGHITRNIKIIGSNEGTIGGHLQIYHYISEEQEENSTIDVRGSALLQGVEFSNMGQPSSENAGLHIVYTNIPKENSLNTVVKGSSIHDCNGFCVNGYYANLVNIENTVIYSAEKFLIQALNCQQWTITDNLLIGAKLKEGSSNLEENGGVWDPVALIHMYTGYTPSVDQHEVRRNVGSGSQGVGFVFPGTPCQEKDQNQFTDNEVGFVGFIGALFNLDENKCYAVGHIQIHSSVQGISINMKQADDGYQAEKIIVAECRKNLILHSASKNHIIHNNFLSNSWVGTYVRQNCQDCYTQERNKVNTRCSNSSGIQLHVTTNSGESFPWHKHPFLYDVICTPTSTYGSSFIDNVEFYNFKQSYENTVGGKQCGNNYSFKNHNVASDATAGTYLTDVKCTECDHQSLIYITDEQEQWQGWFGGCGDFTCTGLENILVQDLTGTFLGHQGSILGHNENVGYQTDNCVWQNNWNAFECVENLDFGVLEWSSEGSDAQEISPIPVYVENDIFENKLNMWREWAWQGPEPLNERLNRFVSLVLVNKWTKINYTGTQSVNLVYKLQQRNPIGENDRFLVVETNYPTTLALEVRVRDQIIQPFSFTKPADLVNDYSGICGAHNYFHTNSTIHFVVTNQPDCQVQIKQVNQIFVNLKIQMTPEEFYSDDAKQTDFTSRISAYLDIPTDRVRIVGLSSARRRILGEEGENLESSVLQISILGEEPVSQNEGYDPTEQYEKLKTEADKLIEGSQTSELDLDVEIEDAYYKLVVLKKVGLEGVTDEDFVDDEWIQNGSEIDDDQNSSETEQDDDNEDDDDNNGQNQNPSDDDENNGKRVTQKLQEEEKSSSNMVSIAVGVIFGIVGVILVSIIGYYFWKKKQVQQIAATELHIPQGEELKSPVKIESNAQVVSDSTN